MANPSQVVTTFLARWEAPGGLEKAIEDYFTPETVWENVGLTTSTGIDEALAVNRAFESTMGEHSITVDVLAIAATGNRVLTERIDHIVDGEGRPIMSPKVMGAFEIEDGRITAWRDYFDSRAAASPQGSE